MPRITAASHGDRGTRFAWLISACVLVLLMAACGGGETSDGASDTADSASEGAAASEGGGEPYKLGFTGALTGPAAFAGVPQHDGFRTYIDFVNSEGGVDGTQIEVEVLDSKADGAVGITNFEQLARDYGALGVFGFTGSGEWAATGPVAEEMEVVQIGISGVDEWVEEEHPYLFKAGMSQQTGANIQLESAQTLMDEAGVDQPTAAVLALDTTSGEVFAEMIKEQLDELGWEVVEEQAVGLAAADCTSQAASIVKSKADIVLANLTSSGEDIVCPQALLERGFEGPIVNNFQSPSQDVIDRLNSDQWYSQRMFAWPKDASLEAAQEMVAQAEEFGYDGEIGPYFTDGYVAGMFMVEALRICGEGCTSQGYRDALESIETLETNGLAGPSAGFTTGPNGHEMTPEALVVNLADEAGASQEWICGIPDRCGE